MFFPQPNVDIGQVLELTSVTLVDSVYTYGTTIAGSYQQLQLDGVVTFHDAVSPTITITVEIDRDTGGYGFAGIETNQPGSGNTVEHVIDPADGLSQRILLQTENAAQGTRWHVGAKSNGVPVSGDTVTLSASGSAL